MMRKLFRKTLILLASSLALVLVILMLVAASSPASAADGEVDLRLSLHAPQHVAPSSTFVINLAYSNTGTLASPEDAWVTIYLPNRVVFVEAVDHWGEPLVPASSLGNSITWKVSAVPIGECCAHIFTSVQVGEEAPEGEVLEISAAIGSSALETNLANNTATLTSLVCDMAGSTKQVQAGEVKPGDVLTYTITLNLAYRNEISSPQSRLVTLTDTLPNINRVRFLGWVGPEQGEIVGNEMRWQGQVGAGEPKQLQYRLGVLGDVVSGTEIVNGAHLAWQGGKMDIETVTSTVNLPPYARMIGPQGFTWRHADGVDIEVPPHAVTETTRFEFRPVFTDTQPVQGPPGWLFAHHAFELTAFRFGEITQFGQAITLTLHLNGQEWAGLERNSLRLWYRNGLGEPWKRLGEPIQSGPDSISFQTDHFTQFALFDEPIYRVHLPFVQGR
jgi:uncharacterized repeat protein (TIGR01451 family)